MREVQAGISAHTTGNWRIYYAPGILVKVERSGWDDFEERLRHPTAQAPQSIRRLADAAQQAKMHWDRLLKGAFKPVCLTLYPTLNCNLKCQYCFAASTVRSQWKLTDEAVLAAMRLVAYNCAQEKVPLSIVFHGGGEPTLAWRQIEALQPWIRDFAQQYGIPYFRYIATNGVLSESRAKWLAQSFDLVGLSCDGPPAIQNRQRPARNHSQSSSAALERTAKILQDYGVPLVARVTITPATVEQQVEICAYICEHLQPTAIHVEPVYPGGRAGEAALLEDAEAFVRAFQQARRIAKQFGVNWEISGSRLGELHGAHCNFLKQVLLLIPGDLASACFKTIQRSQARRTGFEIGRYDPREREFVLDQDKIQALRQQYHFDETCQQCWLRYQCSHGCPASCMLSDARKPNPFICQMQQRLAEARILEAAASLGEEAPVLEARFDDLG